MSKLEQIATFIMVVEKNSFAEAGRIQKISTAAVSRQISNLEATLKTQLLNRSTRKISLTEIGTQYYEHCKNAISEIATAENSIAGSRAEPSGTLNITSTRYFAEKHILPRLHKFMKLYPKLHIKLELAERFPDFNTENIDILFGVSVEGPENLVRRRVAMTRYLLCASPNYLKKFGIPKNPNELRQHRYITHSIRKPDNLLQFKNEKEIYLEPILHLNDTYAMRDCAIQGIGIISMHDYIVQTAIKNGELVEILRDFQKPQLPVYLYYQKSRYLLPKIRKFIDFFVGEI